MSTSTFTSTYLYLCLYLCRYLCQYLYYHLSNPVITGQCAVTNWGKFKIQCLGKLKIMNMGKCCSSWKVREYDVGLGSKSIKKRLTYHLKDWNHFLKL